MGAEAVVDTERLILRRWSHDDAGAFAAINADPYVMRFIGGGKPLSREIGRAHV